MSMMSYRSLLTAAAVLIAGTFPARAQAQSTTCQFRGAPEALADRPSPLDSVAIQLGDGAAKLCYGRPSSRGRAIVGGLDPHGQPWRMGANEPTTLHVPFPIRLGSIELEAGSYSLYAIPGETEWTIVANSNTNRWGIPISPNVRASDVGSTLVRPTQAGDHVETLTFTLRGSGTSGILTYAFERTTFDLEISRR